MTVKRILFIFLSFLAVSTIQAQTRKLDLFQCFELASDSSLRAFQVKNSYLSSYWAYRSFKASRLPQMSLNVSPLQYNRSITQRYDYDQNIDVYRTHQSLSSSAGASVSQYVGLTGGTLTVDSDLGYLRNMGESDFSQFSTTPLRIGYSQSLLGFSSSKWAKKIEPLKFETAKKQLASEIEGISENVIQLFFALALSQKEYEMALENILTTDTLYSVGLERQKISAISQADILTLELDLLNAKNALKNMELALRQSQFRLVSFLNIEENTPIQLDLPSVLPLIIIDKESALDYARENNPDYLNNQRELLEADRELESIKKGNSISVGVSAGIGFNQAASSIHDAYRNLSQQDRLSLSLSLPVFDWGLSRGRLLMAKNSQSITIAAIEQKEDNLRQEIITAVDNFNLQQELILSAEKALQLSEDAYTNTKQRFVVGKSDVNSITIALNRYKDSQRNYINTLSRYWSSFYTIRKLTLYDFAKKEELSSLVEEDIKTYYFYDKR